MIRECESIRRILNTARDTTLIVEFFVHVLRVHPLLSSFSLVYNPYAGGGAQCPSGYIFELMHVILRGISPLHLWKCPQQLPASICWYHTLTLYAWIKVHQFNTLPCTLRGEGTYRSVHFVKIYELDDKTGGPFDATLNLWMNDRCWKS